MTLVTLVVMLSIRRYWETHASEQHLDWSKAERVRLPNLKPPTTSISLRLPGALIERIKIAANRQDVPYQSLIKTWLAEKTGSVRCGPDRAAGDQAAEDQHDSREVRADPSGGQGLHFSVAGAGKSNSVSGV